MRQFQLSLSGFLILKKEDELVSEKEMKDILSDYDLMIKDQVLEMDVTPEEAREIWDEYLTARKTVDEKGMSGLMELFGNKIDDLIDASLPPNLIEISPQKRY